MPGLDTVSEPRVKSLVAATGCEYHLTVEPPPGLAFGESVSLLLKAYDETERTCGLSLDTCITWCFHLSDIASQIRPLRKALRRREGCAFVRTLGQPPASGAKLSLTAFHLKSRGAHLAKHAIDDTLFAVRHGVYRTLLSTSRPTAGTGAGQQTREMFVELDRRYASSGLVLPRDLQRVD